MAGCTSIGVVDLKAELAEKVAKDVRDGGGKAVGIAADVREAGDVKRVVDTVTKELGCATLSALVVGIALFKPLLELSPEEWDSELKLNLRPAFLIGQAVVAEMLKHGKTGNLAFVQSISGLQSAASHAGYGAAKAGMRSLIQTMALEWGGHDIRVNGLAPGPIRTNRVGALPGVVEGNNKPVTLGRMGEVEEIADGLLFLLSDMSTFMTGQIIVMDGGWLTATPGADARPPGR